VQRFFVLTAILGIGIILFGVKQVYQAKIYEMAKLAQAKTILLDKKEKDQFLSEVENNDLIGVIKFPSLKKSVPILEGTTEEELLRGAGHFDKTGMPGDNKQVLISGHRDTVFTQMGELEHGDKIIIELPYGDFEYEIEKTEITDADDTSIVDLGLREEELVVTTCYPFNYVGSAPERYIIYAYPVDDN